MAIADPPPPPQGAALTATLEQEIRKRTPPFSDEAKIEAAEAIDKFTQDLVTYARNHAKNHEWVLQNDVVKILGKLGRGRLGPYRAFLSQMSNIFAGLGGGGLFALVTTSEKLPVVPMSVAGALLLLGLIGMWLTK